METPVYKSKLKPRKTDRPHKAQTRAIKQERELARTLGKSARVTPGSGCGNEKGDVRLPGVIRIECKATQKKSFSVTLEMVRKIEEAALGHGEVPAIEVEFVDKDGNRRCAVAIVPSYFITTLANYHAHSRT